MSQTARSPKQGNTHPETQETTREMEKSLALGERISQLRKSRGLTLSQLSQACALSESTLSRIENGHTDVSAQNLFTLSLYLNVDITCFFRDHTVRPPSDSSLPPKDPGVYAQSAADSAAAPRAIAFQSNGLMPSADTASIRIGRTAEETFDFMIDPGRMDLWSFGTWRVSVGSDGLVTGTAIYDGAQVLVRIEPHQARLLIDYQVGPSADDLQPRIFVRITPGTVIGASGDSCLLTMTALRTDGMDDVRWKRLTTAHALEVELIKSTLETGFDHRTLPLSEPQPDP